MLEHPLAEPQSRRRLFTVVSAVCVVALVGVGVFAKNGWFPTTDNLSGERTGWFGRKVAKNAPSSWNPLALPSPTATPQLSKEYIYAGSRLLAVEDKNANAAPPADLAVYRPAGAGTWWVMGPGGTLASSAGWGTSEDIPAPGDYDGDGKVDFCVFRPSTGTWYTIFSSNNSTSAFGFGTSGDIPVVADFDGDGKTDPTVYRPSTGYWYWLTSSDGYATTLNAPTASTTSDDVAVGSDFDGDGKGDRTVWRPGASTFYTVRSSDNGSESHAMSFPGYTLGGSNESVVTGDYDGDGKANYAVRTGATWLILSSSFSPTTAITPSGDLSNDIAVPNDYDADGICDIAVWRGSNGDWYIRQSASSGSLRQDHWGQAGDIPVPAYWRR